jgi:hypothetical protein
MEVGTKVGRRLTNMSYQKEKEVQMKVTEKIWNDRAF